MLNKKERIYIPIIAVFLGILLGCLILLLSGRSPVLMFNTLVKAAIGFDPARPNLGINTRFPGEFLVSAMPIILTGLSVGFAYRTGMFNIGGEGQIIMGSLASVTVALLVPLPGILHVIVCLLAGAIAGGLWGFIPGILKARFNISEVVSGIMLNYTGMHVANFLLKMLPSSSVTRTQLIPDSASLSSSFLSSITNNSRLNWGFIVVIVATILYWFIIERTSFGYSLRATGFNKDASRYAGLKVNRNVVYSMMISGALAGLAGSVLVLGTFRFGRVMVAFDNYGFDGIAVALVGMCNAAGILLAGLLFSLLKVAQPVLQTVGVPKDIGEIVSSSIVFFVALQLAIKIVVDKVKIKVASKHISRRKEE